MHKVTLGKMFKASNTLSKVGYKKPAGGQEGGREVRQSRIQEEASSVVEADLSSEQGGERQQRQGR